MKRAVLSPNFAVTIGRLPAIVTGNSAATATLHSADANAGIVAPATPASAPIATPATLFRPIRLSSLLPRPILNKKTAHTDFGRVLELAPPRLRVLRLCDAWLDGLDELLHALSTRLTSLHVLQLEHGPHSVYAHAAAHWDVLLRELERLPQLDAGLASHARLRAVVVYVDVPVAERAELGDILAARMPQVHRAGRLHVVDGR